MNYGCTDLAEGRPWMSVTHAPGRDSHAGWPAVQSAQGTPDAVTHGHRGRVRVVCSAGAGGRGAHHGEAGPLRHGGDCRPGPSGRPDGRAAQPTRPAPALRDSRPRAPPPSASQCLALLRGRQPKPTRNIPTCLLGSETANLCRAARACGGGGGGHRVAGEGAVRRSESPPSDSRTGLHPAETR